MAASTRCRPGGPVPRPRPTTADAGQCRPERRLRHPDDVSGRGAPTQRTPCPSRIHQQATAISVGRRRRPAQARIADRSDEPIAPWAACRPRIPFTTKGLGRRRQGEADRSAGRGRATGPGHRGPTVAVAGWSVAVFAQTASRMPILRHFGSTTSWSRHFGHLAPTSGTGEWITPCFGRPRPPYSNDPGVSIHRGRPSGPVARESVPTRFHAMPVAHFGHPVFRGSRATAITCLGPRVSDIVVLPGGEADRCMSRIAGLGLPVHSAHWLLAPVPVTAQDRAGSRPDPAEVLVRGAVIDLSDTGLPPGRGLADACRRAGLRP